MEPRGDDPPRTHTMDEWKLTTWLKEYTGHYRHVEPWATVQTRGTSGAWLESVNPNKLSSGKRFATHTAGHSHRLAHLALERMESFDGRRDSSRDMPRGCEVLSLKPLVPSPSGDGGALARRRFDLRLPDAAAICSLDARSAAALAVRRACTHHKAPKCRWALLHKRPSTIPSRSMDASEARRLWRRPGYVSGSGDGDDDDPSDSSVPACTCDEYTRCTWGDRPAMSARLKGDTAVDTVSAAGWRGGEVAASVPALAGAAYMDRIGDAVDVDTSNATGTPAAVAKPKPPVRRRGDGVMEVPNTTGDRFGEARNKET